MTGPSFVFHAHFYQPPRENPWTGVVPREEGAAPFHDWNARIDDECYRPNGFGRIVDDRDRITDVVNNYEHLSFNVGPTLLAWLERHDPVTLRRMLEADRAAVRGHGHGSAIAQAYNHVILPLADERDRRTQIRWGLAAFRHWFGREAEALWLPETAANADVLDDLIEHSMRFVILAPHQAGRIRPVAGGEWTQTSEAKLDTSVPYLYRHRAEPARTLLVFFYDGRLAHQLSFGDALKSSARFVARVREADKRRGEGPLVHAAADGETAGHHTAWGDRVLAHALTRAVGRTGLEVTSYASLVDQLEPPFEVELAPGPDGEGTAWSCAHGVGRWIRDCGCSTQAIPGWNQRWRAGLRAALDLLRDRARPWFEVEAGRVFTDPWAARDDYVRVILDPTDPTRLAFLDRHARAGLADEVRQRGLELLELQHQLLLQYTSCGWFFDDIGGLESRQVLRYAARAIEIWDGLGGTPPRDEFLELLEGARSNDPRIGSGAHVLASLQERDVVRPGHLFAAALLHANMQGTDHGRFGDWSWNCSGHRRVESESRLLHLGRVRLAHDPTGRRSESVVAVRWVGEFDLLVHVGAATTDLDALEAEIRDALPAGTHPDVLERHLGPLAFETEELVNEGTSELFRPLVAGEFGDLRGELAGIADRYAPVLRASLGQEEGRLMGALARHAQAEEARRAIAALLEGEGELPSAVAARIRRTGIDPVLLRPQVESFVEGALRSSRLAEARRAIELARSLGIPLHLHRAQEAWLEGAAGFPAGQSPRALGELLGFSAGFAAAAVAGRAPEPAREEEPDEAR